MKEDGHIANWIVGLVDGEGSFNIQFQNFPAMKLGFEARPMFLINLDSKDRQILELIRNFFGFGVVRTYERGGDYKGTGKACYYKVTNLNDCLELMNFFRKYTLRSKKLKDFEMWCQCLLMIIHKENLNKKGLLQIAKIREGMNLDKKNRYSNTFEFVRKTIEERELLK
jgi:hypothetical protein